MNPDNNSLAEVGMGITIREAPSCGEKKRRGIQSEGGAEAGAPKRKAPDEDASPLSEQPIQFGFPVNGFHPQWPVSAGATVLFSGASGHFGTAEFFPPSFVESRLNAKIEELIGRVRREEAQKYLRRKEELDTACDNSGAGGRPSLSRPAKRRRSLAAEESGRLEEESPPAPTEEDVESSSASDFSDVYSDVFVNSNVAQVIATPGGRVVAWNDEFLNATGFLPNQVCSSLTVFNLVQAKMLPKLFDLFSLALRGGSPSPLILQSPLRAACLGGGFEPPLQAKALEKTPSLISDFSNGPLGGGGGGVPSDADAAAGGTAGDHRYASDDEEEEDDDADDDATHASVTLPCVRFSPRLAPLLVTVTLMNDVDPEKRCFHCVFAPDCPRHDDDAAGGAVEREQRRAEELCAMGREMGEIRRISHKKFANLL